MRIVAADLRFGYGHFLRPGRFPLRDGPDSGLELGCPVRTVIPAGDRLFLCLECYRRLPHLVAEVSRVATPLGLVSGAKGELIPSASG